MSTYASDIVFAVVAFPFIAFGITLPYLIYQYRKYGSVPWLRTLVVYSFVFYLLCAYFLVLLPLPDDHTAYVSYAAHPQLVPFAFVGKIASQIHITTSPSTWLTFLRTPAVYEAFFNMLLTVPFGMFLRYYFRRTWWQVLILGFCLTLSFETLQLTGLLGIYEHPYRLFDVDDLIVNTTGAMVGFWMMGPLMHKLPDVRLVNAAAQAAGVHAGVTRRALSFFIDLAIAQVGAGLLSLISSSILLGAQTLGADAGSGAEGIAETTSEYVALALFFFVVPAITHGQTLGQKILRLCIVRPDATQARWYQYLARYGLLFGLAWAPFALLFGLIALSPDSASESGVVATFFAGHQTMLILIWFALMGIWSLTLVIRAIRSAVKRCPFVMLNGLMSNTRVMTCAGVKQERERRRILDVADVVVLEQKLVEEGTPLSELMASAGYAIAKAVRTWVPDPAPVVVLSGSGNNGGDGWVAAHALAEATYPVTLIVPDIAERLHAEPARSTALALYADASARELPLRVLVAPDADVLADALEPADAVVDALLGTGFSGDEIREPYATWIRAANRRRFEGPRVRGEGKHRKRTHERGDHERFQDKTVPRKAKDAPFAVSADVPSGLSAQTGVAANPTFAADVTVTMLAYKPGLVTPASDRWTGVVQLAQLVEEPT